MRVLAINMCVAALGVGAMPAVAENATTTSPSSDYQLIVNRAKEQRRALSMIDRLHTTAAEDKDQARLQLEATIDEYTGMNRGQNDNANGYDISTRQKIWLAGERSRVAADLLRMDLDGDWAITRDEAVEAMNAQGGNGAAERYLRADRDGDATVSRDELIAAITNADVGRVTSEG